MFLEEVALIADIDSMEDDSAKITLMTLHGAKGLEFPYVYITGMEEGLFPSALSINSDDRSELEEERRICYVGITRAMDKLTLTFARERMINGQTVWSKASRFVEEIPDEYLEKHLLEKDYGASSLSSFGDFSDSGFGKRFEARKKAVKEKTTLLKGSEVKKADSLDYGVGDRVSHIKFGEGTVTEIKDGERDYEVTVVFDEAGQRNLLAGFAKLQKL